MTLNEGTELAGTWWVPGMPEKAYYSKLTLDARGRGRLRTVPKHIPQTNRLFGRLSNGSDVTLARQRVDDLQAQWNEVFVGAHVDAIDDLLISSMRIYFLKVHTRSNFHRFSLVGQAIDPLTSPKPWPTHPKFSISARFKDADICTSVGVEHAPRLARRDSGVFIRDEGTNPCLVMKFEDVVPFGEAKNNALEMQDFVSFGMGRAAIVDRVELVSASGLQLEYIGKWRCARDHISGLSLSNMLFSLDRVGLDEALLAWYWALDNLYPAPQVITYRYYQPGFLEHDLSAAVSAMENMHKQLGFAQTKRVPAPDGADEIRDLLDQAPLGEAQRAARKALKSRKVDVTFSEKLVELTNQLPDSVFQILRFDRETWVEEVKEQRNGVSHTGSHVAVQGPNASVDLERGIARSRILLMLLLMKVSGFPADTIDSAIKDLASQAAETQEPA